MEPARKVFQKSLLLSNAVLLWDGSSLCCTEVRNSGYRSLTGPVPGGVQEVRTGADTWLLPWQLAPRARIYRHQATKETCLGKKSLTAAERKKEGSAVHGRREKNQRIGIFVVCLHKVRMHVCQCRLEKKKCFFAGLFYMLHYVVYYCSVVRMLASSVAMALNCCPRRERHAPANGVFRRHFPMGGNDGAVQRTTSFFSLDPERPALAL